jgi:membrane protein
MNVKEFWTITKEAFKDWNEDKAPRLAAALSYYTVFSLAPLLVLIIAIAGFIIGSDTTIRTQLIDQIRGLVGVQGATAVEELIANTSQPRNGILATVIGIVTLLIGATGVFGQLQDALNTIWEVEPKKGRGIMALVKDRFLSFTMILGTSFLLLVSLVISTFLSILNNYFTGLLGGIGIVAQILNFVISIGVITLIFALIFKVLPDVKVDWKDVWIGALVTALLFTIGKTLLGLYLGGGAATSAYGAAGSLVILLFWVYYSAQILFLGAEFTQVYARHHHPSIEPTENARPITESERAQQGISPRKEPRLEPAQSIRRDMLPVTGQPQIHPETEEGGSRVRHEPPNPNTVIPVIAAGTLASLYTISRIIRKLIP